MGIALLLQPSRKIAEMRLQHGLLEAGEDIRPGEKAVDHLCSPVGPAGQTEEACQDHAE